MSTELREALLAGPRGRRLLLNIVIRSEEAHQTLFTDDSVWAAVAQESAREHLSASSAGLVLWSLVGDVETGSERRDGGMEHPVSASEIARRIRAVRLVAPTPLVIQNCLADSVDAARYWQEPDAGDQIAAQPAVIDALGDVADQVLASDGDLWTWMTRPLTAGAPQYVVSWPEQGPVLLPGSTVPDPLPRLREQRQELVDDEQRYARMIGSVRSATEVEFSGTWWVTPSVDAVVHSAGTVPDGTPAALWFVEDNFGEEHAEVRALHVPPGLRIYEVDSADAWAELCRRFPLEVTHQKRSDWYVTTGRDGRWIIPDWFAVAEHYDAVHLQTRAYLALAGTVIDVDATNGTASTIAGWNPDETLWFSTDIRLDTDSTHWEWHDFEDEGTSASLMAWVKQPAPPENI